MRCLEMTDNDDRTTARSPLQTLCRIPISLDITRITRPQTRPVAGAQIMPGSVDIDLLPVRIHTHILLRSGLSHRAIPMFAGKRLMDSAISPHALAGRRQSWIASTESLGLEGQRNSSEYSSSLPLLVPLGKAEPFRTASCLLVQLYTYPLLILVPLLSLVRPSAFLSPAQAGLSHGQV